ncbi:MAG: MFS transporter [Longibaculum sp.]
MYSKNVKIMFAMSFFQGMVFYGPIATLYRQKVGVSVFEITLIESLSLIFAILLEIPWGMIADKIGYKKSMIICSLLYFVSKIIFYNADSFITFLIERLILSIVIAGLSGLDSSIIYLSANGQSQKIFSIYNNLGTIGLIFAAGIYSFFIRDHYRFAAFLTMICYGIAFFLSLGLEEVKSQKEKNCQSSLKDYRECFQEFLKHKSFLLFLIAIAIFNETHQTITTFLNQLQFLSGGLNNQHIGYIYIITTLCGLLGIFSTSLTKRLGETKFILTSFMIMLFSCLCLMITYQPLVSVFSIISMRIVFSLLQPLQMKIQNQHIISRNRATLLSLNAVIMDSIAIVINLILGKLADIHLTYAMMFAVILSFISIILYSLWLKVER